MKQQQDASNKKKVAKPVRTKFMGSKPEFVGKVLIVGSGT